MVKDVTWDVRATDRCMWGLVDAHRFICTWCQLKWKLHGDLGKKNHTGKLGTLDGDVPKFLYCGCGVQKILCCRWWSMKERTAYVMHEKFCTIDRNVPKSSYHIEWCTKDLTANIIYEKFRTANIDILFVFERITSHYSKTRYGDGAKWAPLKVL